MGSPTTGSGSITAAAAVQQVERPPALATRGSGQASYQHGSAARQVGAHRGVAAGEQPTQELLPGTTMRQVGFRPVQLVQPATDRSFGGDVMTEQIPREGEQGLRLFHRRIAATHEDARLPAVDEEAMGEIDVPRSRHEWAIAVRLQEPGRCPQHAVLVRFHRELGPGAAAERHALDVVRVDHAVPAQLCQRLRHAEVSGVRHGQRSIAR